MAYSIRYTAGKGVFRYLRPGVPVRTVTALMLLTVTCIVRLCSARGSAFLAAMLDHEPGNLTELAVTAMADSLAAGEGWYHALAVWCRTVLFGAP